MYEYNDFITSAGQVLHAAHGTAALIVLFSDRLDSGRAGDTPRNFTGQ